MDELQMLIDNYKNKFELMGKDSLINSQNLE